MLQSCYLSRGADLEILCMRQVVGVFSLLDFPYGAQFLSQNPFSLAPARPIISSQLFLASVVLFIT